MMASLRSAGNPNEHLTAASAAERAADAAASSAADTDDAAFLTAYRRAAELLMTLAALKEQRADVAERKRDAVRSRDACGKAQEGSLQMGHAAVLVSAGGGVMHRMPADAAYRRAVAAITECDKRGDELDAAIDAFHAEYARLPAWARRNAGDTAATGHPA
jgi:hypothetical protein